VLDPRRLHLLVCLERLGTIRAVAGEVSMSPSSVSQQLATLQRESGTALLVRHGRSVTLTAAGLELAAHAREILERIGAAEDELRARRENPAGTVRVAAFTIALRAFVIEAARGLTHEHPDLHVHLSELEPLESVPAVARGDVDIAVVADFGEGALPRDEILRRVPLLSDQLFAVLPVGSPAGTGAISLFDLRAEPWLVDGTELERHITRRCRREGFEPRVAGRLSSHSSLLPAVAAGLGVTVMPALAIDTDANVVARPLDPPLRIDLLALHRAETTRRRAVTVTLEAVVAAGTRQAATRQ
jgi:DNA-binding transcriptional LysR family regulator